MQWAYSYDMAPKSSSIMSCIYHTLKIFAWVWRPQPFRRYSVIPSLNYVAWILISEPGFAKLYLIWWIIECVFCLEIEILCHSPKFKGNPDNCIKLIPPVAAFPPTVNIIGFLDSRQACFFETELSLDVAKLGSRYIFRREKRQHNRSCSVWERRVLDCRALFQLSGFSLVSTERYAFSLLLFLLGAFHSHYVISF